VVERKGGGRRGEALMNYSLRANERLSSDRRLGLGGSVEPSGLALKRERVGPIAQLKTPTPSRAAMKPTSLSLSRFREGERGRERGGGT
jgi:hypothetical protein